VRGVPAYERAGLKDVVWLGREEKVLVEAHYAPWDGVYMFHCHNLVHEDDDMMAAFNVTALEGFKYKSEEGFMDPMEGRWRARGYERGDLAGRTGPFGEREVERRVREMVGARPYGDVGRVERELEVYWNRTVAGALSKGR